MHIEVNQDHVNSGVDPIELALENSGFNNASIAKDYTHFTYLDSQEKYRCHELPSEVAQWLCDWNGDSDVTLPFEFELQGVDGP